MLRSKIQHLLEFRAAAAAPVETDGPPEAMTGWMSSIGEIEQPGGSAGVAPPEKKETGNGSAAVQPGGDPNAAGNAANKGGTADESAKAAAAAAAAAESAKQAEAAKAAEAEKAKKEAADKQAAEAAAKEKQEKEKGSGEEKWPRTSADWDKFKANRKQERDALEKEIKTRDETIATLQAQVKESQEASSKAGAVSPETQKEIEQLKAENELYSQRLQELEVTAHPRFQAHFKGLVDEQVSIAKEILGEEKGKRFEEIVNIPNHPSLREFKKEALNDLLSELSPYESGSVANVTTALRLIDRQREAEIAKSKEHTTKLGADATEKQKAAATQAAAAREKLFNDTLKSMQDGKDGVAIYQLRDGDEAWNKDVAQRTAAARTFLFGGKDVKPQDLAKAAFQAAAFPSLLSAYASDMKEKDASIAALTEQVKKLTAAQPGARNGAGANQGGEEGVRKVELKPEMTPFEASRAWAESVMAAGRE